MEQLYADIAVNLPVDSLFTYIIPVNLQDKAKAGVRALIPFGRRNITGIITEIRKDAGKRPLKPIIRILDAEPSVTPEMISFCKWISSYYVCPPGEVLFSAFPRGTAVGSKTIYSLSGSPENIAVKFTPLQKKITGILSSREMSAVQLEKKLGSKSIRTAISALLKNGVLNEQVVMTREKVGPRYMKFVLFEMLDDFSGFSGAMLENFIKENKIRSQKQADALNYLIRNRVPEIRLTDLVRAAGTSATAVRSLEKKGLISLQLRQVGRETDQEFTDEEKVTELNPEQRNILEEIIRSVDSGSFEAFLLFGVTGSGKTQVYIEAIKHVLSLNRTAIVLVPEISLTPQLIHRFRSYFGDMIGVIHSRLSEGQKYDTFGKIQSGTIRIVIGARSALFSPLKDIGIIVVDEEHDHSYKQTEKSPRYNARDSAIVRAKLNNAAVVLGSATPSLESFYNAKAGKFKLLELPHRALKTKQPKIEVVNMLEELRSPSKFIRWETPEKRFLSTKLISYIHETLSRKQSVILLQNRRGYSAYQECQECGFVKMCPNCDITMIYHKLSNHLRCHYCGHAGALALTCENCGSRELLLKGTGTEKVEEEIARLFPEARLRRMDADTVRKKDSHRRILKSFREGEFDILVGTQMISKGLDFPNVYLVGVVSADVGLLNPDFRSYERTFQLLMQVAGRSGRSSDLGRVVIQTMQPDNHIFPLVRDHDYISFYEKETASRENFGYPPYSRMVLIEVKGPDREKAQSLSSKIYLFIKGKNRDGIVEVMKPAPALIFKLRNKFRYHIIIKSLKSRRDSYQFTEKLLKMIHGRVRDIGKRSKEQVIIDVDPVSFS